MAVACPCLPANGSIHTCSLCHCTKLRGWLLPANPSACRRCHKGRAHVFVHPLGLGKMPSRQIELKIKLIALKSWDAFQVGGRAHTLKKRTAVGTTMPAKVSPGGSGWTGCP